MQLIIAEKPSVARDLARVLGVRAAGKSQFEGEGRVITWCVGHLVELEEPAAYDPRWKHWRLDTLPMIPDAFRLRPATQAPEQYRMVRTLLRDRRFGEVVNACDAGREGELIFRYVYQLAGSRLPIKRLWISSMTDEAIRSGFSQLRPGAQYAPLADAARCRSEADWLVGMNATRAVTARHRTGRDGALYSIGRVQTPTLAMLVAREKAIRAFVPTDYWEVRGAFRTADDARFHATFTHEKRTRLASGPLARDLVARAQRHAAASDPQGPRVESVRTKTVREPAPLLFDLTSLQRTANRRYGFSAARTLEIAQSLYERHKVLTYPRTDSRHLSRDVAGELPKLFDALRNVPEYAQFADELATHPPRPSKRVFDDARVQDHHAIIPTGKAARIDALDTDERKIFDLVARRFLGVFFPDAEFANTEVVVRVGIEERSAAVSEARKDDAGEDAPLSALPPPPDRFVARGRVRLSAGWQAVAGIDGADEAPSERKEGKGESEPAQSLPALREGQALDGAFEPLSKQTKPPHRHTEATLLAAMESAGKSIDDDALRLAMKDRGLGTPATRAAVIETLLKRGFVSREKKNVVPTPMGIALIDALPVESLASPELTGEWEARLARIARGEDSREAFMADIVKYVRETVDTIRESAPSVSAAVANAPAGPAVGKCPRCGGDVVELVRGFSCGMGGRACQFAMPKIVAGRALSAPLAGVLLSKRRTQVLRGFRSRAGKSFSAALVLDPDGTLRFSFGDGSDDRKSHGGEASPPEARARSTTRRAAKPLLPPSAPAPSTTEVGDLACPKCKQGALVTGKRGWGCARWREGCDFVVWFEAAGKAVTAVQLRELIAKGRTRKGKWTPGNGPPVSGRLVLDANASGGAVRFEAG